MYGFLISNNISQFPSLMYFRNAIFRITFIMQNLNLSPTSKPVKCFKVKDRKIKEEKVNQIAVKSNKNDFICKYCPNCHVYITSLRGLMPFNFVYDPTCAEFCFSFSEGTVCLCLCQLFCSSSSSSGCFTLHFHWKTCWRQHKSCFFLWLV